VRRVLKKPCIITNARPGFEIYNNCPYRIGLPEHRLSGLEMFELWVMQGPSNGDDANSGSVDPAEWVPRGYAVVNVNSRGTWESDGNLYIEGTQSGKNHCRGRECT
jgi:predicted acyl esterase